ncbi:hypothetical protein ACVPPR_08505 [Dellaglioa sp. L3N]
MKINNKVKLTVLTLGLLFLVNISSVSASGGIPNTDYDGALGKAPRAILMTGLFQTGTGAGVTPNSGMVGLDSLNKVSSKPSKTLVKITDAKNQKAAVWSSDTNSFDINTDDKASMWIYFGNANSGAGDGMALVLQNDPNNNKAISSIAGETLGVWGNDSGAKSAGDVAKSAIQNSWALEFDTHKNDGTNTNNAFDFGLAGDSHIASGYPAEADTYAAPYKGASYYTQKHSGLITYGGYLSNSKWHHVTINYKSIDAKNGSMTYAIDDKAPISETKPLDPTDDVSQPGQTATVPIDKSKFNSTDGKIRWGFTGSTGDNFENNLVMFEQVPGLVNATAVQTITDVTQNKDLPADGTGTVKSGDQLKFTTKATYLGGKQNWKDPAAYLKYPADNIKWTETILNDDKPNILGPDSIWGEEPGSGATFGADFSKDNPTGKIAYVGTVGPVTEDTPQTSPAGQIIGSNAMIDSNAVSYTIEAAPKMTLSIDNLKDIDVDYGKDATITGTVKSSLGGDIAKGAKASVTISGDKTPIEGDVATDGTFSVTVPKAKLTTSGEKTYTVQATDVDGNTTDKTDKDDTKKINIHPVLTLNDNNDTVIAPYTFTFQVVDNSATITTYYKEGKDGTPVQLEKYDNSKPGSTDDHTVALDESKLAVGSHELTVYSVDSAKDTSNEQTITVVIGSLSVSSDDTITFKNKIPAQTSVLDRTADYTLNLETSAAKNWTLSATAGPLTAQSDKSTLKDSTIGFRDSDKGELTPLNAISTTIDSGVGQIKTIAKTWSKDSGILLNVAPSEIHANEVYTSEIDWTLTDASAS